MLDIREILKSLSSEDKIVWEQCRTEMRRSYLTAHNMIVGMHAWDKHDDAFMDLIDIKIAILFDRSGKIPYPPIVKESDAEPIEEQIVQTSKVNTDKLLKAIMQNGNNDPWQGNGK